MPSKADILCRLQNEILSLQGFKPAASQDHELGLGPITQSFLNARFPLAALHELLFLNKEEGAATNGFVCGLLSTLLCRGGTALWTSAIQRIFPPALAPFGIHPEQVLFTTVKTEKEGCWVAEEALTCHALSVVVCEMKELSFTMSRRFQLLIEKSGVPLFVLRQNPKNLATAAVTRWHIKPLPSKAEEDLPGVGHPRWQVTLLKARNGKTGTWEVEWRQGRFYYPSKLAVVPGLLQTKTA